MSEESNSGAVDRRTFMRAAVAVGAVVSVGAVATPAAAAKKCTPVAPRKPYVTRFTLESEVGDVFQGRLDLQTVVKTAASGGAPASIDFELFFDRYEEGISIKNDTDNFAKLALVHQELHRPPTALLTWGTGLAFRGVLQSFKAYFTAFAEDGTPVAAVGLSRFQVLEECAK